jgi:hypothetical protein
LKHPFSAVSVAQCFFLQCIQVPWASIGYRFRP